MSVTGSHQYIGEPSQDKEQAQVGKKHGREIAQVLHTFISSAIAFRPLRRNFNEFFAHYTNQPLKLRTRRGSQIPTGQASEQVDTFVAEYMIKLFNTRPLCAIIPRGNEDTDAARSLEKLIQFNYDHMDALTVWYEIVMSMCIYGTGPAKLRWVDQKIKVPGERPGTTEEKVTYRGPIITPWFVYDYYPDPRKRSQVDHYPSCTASWHGIDHFQQGAKEGRYIPDAVRKIGDTKEFLSKVGEFMGDLYFEDEQRRRLGFTQDNRMEKDGILTIEWEGWYRETEMAAPKMMTLTLANGELVRMADAQIVGGESSTIVAKMGWLPGQLMGVGLVQKAMPQLHVSNLLMNASLTQVTDVIRGLRVVKPDALYFPGDLDNPPGGNLMIKRKYNPKEVVMDVPQNDFSNGLYTMTNMLMDRAEGVSAANQIKLGRISTGERTATETNTAFQQISQRFQLPLMLFEQTGVNVATRKMHLLNRQYLDPETLYKIVDSDTQFFPKVTPENLALDPDYVCLASQREANTAQTVNELNGAIKNLIPMAQLDAKYTQLIDKFLTRVYEELKFRDIDEIKKIMQVPQPIQGSPGQAEGGVLGLPQPGRSQNRQPDAATSLTSIAKSIGAVAAPQ